MRFEGKVAASYIYLEVEEIIAQPLNDAEFEIPKMQHLKFAFRLST